MRPQASCSHCTLCISFLTRHTNQTKTKAGWVAFWQPCKLLKVKPNPKFYSRVWENQRKKELAGQFESDKMVENESVNESLSISPKRSIWKEIHPLAEKYSSGSDKLPFLQSLPHGLHQYFTHYDVLSPITGVTNVYFCTNKASLLGQIRKWLKAHQGYCICTFCCSDLMFCMKIKQLTLYKQTSVSCLCHLPPRTRRTTTTTSHEHWGQHTHARAHPDTHTEGGQNGCRGLWARQGSLSRSKRETTISAITPLRSTCWSLNKSLFSFP